MVHALTVLAVLLFAAPLARFIPLAVLSAILMVVCYNMGEWHEIPEILKLPKLEIGVWLTTLLLTVFADLTVAVEAGMVLAALVFIRRVTATTTVSRITEEDLEDGRRCDASGERSAQRLRDGPKLHSRALREGPNDLLGRRGGPWRDLNEIACQLAQKRPRLRRQHGRGALIELT